jgi:uncharacterized RDD family membrane protein YckC
MDRRQDPRSIVTPYAFSVHPDLLGIPLATPTQRLGAIGIDLVVIFGLTRIGGLTLGLASGILLFWLAVRNPGRNIFGKLFRFTIGCLGLSVLIASGVVVWGIQLAERLEEDPESLPAWLGGISEVADSVGVNVQLSGEGVPDSIALGALARVVPDLFAIRGAESADEARAVIRRMAVSGREGGLSLQEIRTSLAGLLPQDASWSEQSEAIIDEVMTDLRTGLQDTSVEGPHEPSREPSTITDSLALDSISALNEVLGILDEERQDAEDQLSRTQARLEELEEGGLLSWLWSLIDDLGLGFGWGALYLTITHAWWKGTSVGKKIFRIRVVMIDKRPLNWWLSFERAGGYAAGFATGLLGFAQIFWDPNRQAIHDKVSETIVIQDGKSAVPGPWVVEGKAQWVRGRSHAP